MWSRPAMVYGTIRKVAPMTAQIIDGRKLAMRVRDEVRVDAGRFRQQTGRAPALHVTLVGDDAASEVYVRNKARAAEKSDIDSHLDRLPATTDQATLERHLANKADDPSVDGVLLQLPLPRGLDVDAALAKIGPDKDVDGLTVASQGRLMRGQPGLRPCTPSGCVLLAKEALGDLSGRNVVVIGRSILVGKPAALLFLAEDCTVSLAHSRTRDLAHLCRSADIVVAASGQPEMVDASWIRPGACVIDVGITRAPDPAGPAGATRLVGDVLFEQVREVAGWITPVPGGVGPMTVACLLANTVAAARQRAAAPAGALSA